MVIYLIFWIASHALLSFSILRRQLFIFLSIVLLPFFLIFHYFVDTNGDKAAYLNYYADLNVLVADFELGFWYASVILSKILEGEQAIFTFYQIFLFCLCWMIYAKFDVQSSLSKKPARKMRNIDCVVGAAVVLASVFYFLGAHNVIRQALSLCFCFLSLHYFSCKKYLPSLVLAGCGVLFHKSAPLFICALFCFYVVCQYSASSVLRYALWGAAIGLVLKSLLLAVVPESVYFDTDFEWAGDRTASELKYIALVVSFLSVHFITTPSAKNSLAYKFRVLFIAFLFPFSTEGEIYARLVLAYYLLEIIFIRTLIEKKSFGNLLGVGLILASYAIAPNILRLIKFPD